MIPLVGAIQRPYFMRDTKVNSLDEEATNRNVAFAHDGSHGERVVAVIGGLQVHESGVGVSMARGETEK
jgi:hypothetical protein